MIRLLQVKLCHPGAEDGNYIKIPMAAIYPSHPEPPSGGEGPTQARNNIHSLKMLRKYPQHDCKRKYEPKIII
ncbi:MAG TPA: hypothetical protein VFM80_00225 [Gracilimonas sp.]|uniref:hypothetical protein n=1 Tax=Gracilimonas sp. TaxID=1974203 RepID=UPI002D81BB04|nr:hypothetical protein [Gracilimonas sp.]